MMLRAISKLGNFMLVGESPTAEAIYSMDLRWVVSSPLAPFINLLRYGDSILNMGRMQGTGKTSLASALAGHFQLDVYALSLSDGMTDHILRSVMLNEHADFDWRELHTLP